MKRKSMKKSIFITLFCVLATSICLAQQGVIEKKPLPAKLVNEVNSEIDADKNRLVDIYKDIHQNPELGFTEVRTSEIVAKELEALGYKVKAGIGKTGVAAIMKNGDGPVVMYRADMDAIAAEEKTGLSYASTKRATNHDGDEVPVAHLCGHDAHTTWMLGMAKVMAELKDSWSGTLVLIGQPSEESIEGASAMVNDGLFTKYNVPKPEYLIGMHTVPIPTGSVIISDGLLAAGRGLGAADGRRAHWHRGTRPRLPLGLLRQGRERQLPLGHDPAAAQRRGLRDRSRTRAPQGAEPHAGVLAEGGADDGRLRVAEAMACGERGGVCGCVRSPWRHGDPLLLLAAETRRVLSALVQSLSGPSLFDQTLDPLCLRYHHQGARVGPARR